MTVYRVGDDTPFVQSLIRAAEAGKQVACVIELNARFDEERNIHWSRELENVGAHVVFGVAGPEDPQQDGARGAQGGDRHALLCPRRDGQLPHANGQAVRGPRPAHHRPVITGDVVTLFNFLTGRSRTPEFDALVVAPIHMRSRFVELIEREIENHEAGRPARIVCKMNQLEDREMCTLLSQASQAGVPIQLIVRGLCCCPPASPD